MTRQIAVRLDPEIGRALDAVARRSRQRRSDIVRRALRAYLVGGASLASEEAADRTAGRLEAVRHLVGTFVTGDPDRGQQHRKHLHKRIRRGR